MVVQQLVPSLPRVHRRVMALMSSVYEIRIARAWSPDGMDLVTVFGPNDTHLMAEVERVLREACDPPPLDITYLVRDNGMLVRTAFRDEPDSVLDTPVTGWEEAVRYTAAAFDMPWPGSFRVRYEPEA